MLSFYQKLASKLNETAAGSPQDVVAARAPAPAAPVAHPAPSAPVAAPAEGSVEVMPDGADPLDIDLYQSESRMVLFCQISGVALEECELNIDEESNTLVIHATQKRPELPAIKGKKEGDAPEKGRYAKNEIKWRQLYRKVYLPASFDSSSAEAYLEKGVLVVLLPAKQPGTGKKLTIREITDDKHPE